MNRIRRRPVLSAIVGLALLGVLLIGGIGMYLASETGSLPWQSDPTRIPVPTAFTGIDGFSVPTPLPTATHAP
jgi:hypothetical protein